MGYEFRKGPPSREQVEAALKQGLLWEREGSTAPTKVIVEGGTIKFDTSRPFICFRSRSEADNWAFRPIRLGDKDGQVAGENAKMSEAVLVDWAALDVAIAAPAAAPPSLAVGDVVSLRAWEGCVQGLTFMSDSDRPRLTGQTATITSIGGHHIAVKRDGIPMTAWLRSHVDLVSPAPKAAAVEAQPAAIVPYRDFPTTEQIRAHEANGGVWQLEEGYCRFVALWHCAGALRGWHIDSASESRGPGWELASEHRARKHRPVLTDGTPVAWETLGTAVPVVKATALKRDFKVGDTVQLGRHTEIDGWCNWNDAMELYVGQLAKIIRIDIPGVRDEGSQVVRVDTNSWQWRCCNMELVHAVESVTPASPTPAATTVDVPFRPFSELTPAVIAAHKGEWKHSQDATRHYKFEWRGAEVLADLRGRSASYFTDGLRPYLQIDSSIPSRSWRPVDAADVPVPWATLETAAQALQASSVPAVTAAPDVRPFTEIPVALLAAHKGEWEEPSAQRIWKFEVRPDGVWVDWRSGVMPYSIVLEPPDSQRSDAAKKTKLRPIDSAGLPIPWVALAPVTVQAIQPDTIVFTVQETTMPTAPMTATTPAPKSRFRRAVDTASTRVPVELGLNRLHGLIVKKALKGFKGTKQERQVVANFLTGALKSEYGKAAMAGVLAALIPYAAPMVGKHGPFVEAVADECANRGATIIGVEAGGMVLDAIGPLVDIVASMLSSAEKTHKLAGEDTVRDAELAALSPGRGVDGSASVQLGLDVAVPAQR